MSPPTAMSDIPPNIAHGIVEALAAVDRNNWLGYYATVSRNFQHAVEKHTFRQLYLTSARLDDLGRIVTQKRQLSVQVVTLHVALASYDKWQRADKESQDDGDATTRIVTSTIQDLFSTMSTWSSSDGSPTGIHLELLVESPSDESAQSSRYIAPSKTRRARKSAAGLDVYAQTLPKVPVVSAFTCSGTGRHIKLETVSLLLEKFPALRLLDAELEHDTTDERDLEQRQVFILGLEHCAPNVTDLRFRRPHTPPETRRAGSTASRSLAYNVLTRYTLRCVSLTFDDCIDAKDYLSPFKNEGQLDQQHPYWPYLERLHIRNSYLMRRPYMRVQTRAQALKQVDQTLLLVGRAVRYMPMINDIKIRLYVLQGSRLEQINVQYYAWNGGASISFTGTTPMRPTVEAWRASVMKARGMELQVRSD